MTRALFIHVPRTGGNTMRYMYREHIHVYSHDTVEQVKMRFSQTWDQHWKFGFVRNPWDRMVSLYFNSRYSRHEHIPTGLGQLQQDFHWWLHRPRITRKGYEWIHQQSPANMLCIDGEVAVDEVFEFDDMYTAHRFIAATLEVPPTAVRHRKAAPRPCSAKSILSDRGDRELIARIGAWEIDRYGYTFEGATR